MVFSNAMNETASAKAPTPRSQLENNSSAPDCLKRRFRNALSLSMSALGLSRNSIRNRLVWQAMLSEDTKRWPKAAAAYRPKASSDTPMPHRDVGGTLVIFNRLSSPARAVTRNPTAPIPARDVRSSSAENGWYLSSNSQSCFNPSTGMSGGSIRDSAAMTSSPFPVQEPRSSAAG